MNSEAFIFVLLHAFLTLHEWVELHLYSTGKNKCKSVFQFMLRKMLMSAFLFRFKANYLGKNAWLPLFPFVDYNSPCKDILFPHGPNLAQKSLYLLGTVLKTSMDLATFISTRETL